MVYVLFSFVWKRLRFVDYLCIDMSLVYLSSFEPYLQQYLNPYLASISGIIIRVLRIVFTSGLRLVFKPYLTLIWPVQSWNEWKISGQSMSVDPTVSVSYPYPLANSLRTFDRKFQLSSFTIWKWTVLQIWTFTKIADVKVNLRY